MKCKNCGAQNEDYLEYCEQCAAPLTPDNIADNADSAVRADSGYQSYAASTGETPPAWGFVKAPQWPKPDFDANTVTEEDIPENYFSRFNPRPADAPRPAQQSAPVAPQEDFDYDVRPHRSVQKQPAPVQERSSHRGMNASASVEEPVVAKPQAQKKNPADEYDEFADAYSRPRTRSPRKASKGPQRNLFFIGAAGALVVLILLFGFILVQARHGGSFSKFISCTFKGDPILRVPTVEATTVKSGDPGYLITVNTKRNCSFRFTAGTLVTEKEIEKNSVKLSIPEEVWIPDEPLDSAVLSVTPDIVIITAKGEETQVEFEEPITITVPTIELTVAQPAVANFTVESATIPVSGVVGDNTASVFVGENQVSVNEAGEFSTTYTLPAEGTYELVIKAQKNGCMSAVQTFNVTYSSSTDPTTTPTTPQGNVALGVGEAVKRYGTEATMTVTGTMETGATVSVTGVELEGTLTQDSAAGTFSFTVKTPDVGVYEVSLTALKGDAAKTMTLLLERQPDLNTYSSGAYALDYESIVRSPNQKQAYKVVGTVTEIRQSAPYVIARIKTDKGDIMFFYVSGKATVEVNDGKTYELFADPYGTDAQTGLPYMHAWFIYKKAN